jgi:hypothetical protein
MLSQTAQIEAPLQFGTGLVSEIEQPDRRKHEESVLPAAVHGLFAESARYGLPEGEPVVDRRRLCVSGTEQTMRLREITDIPS